MKQKWRVPIQQSISNAIYFFWDSAGAFSKQDLAGSPNHQIGGNIDIVTMLGWHRPQYHHVIANIL